MQDYSTFCFNLKKSLNSYNIDHLQNALYVEQMEFEGANSRQARQAAKNYKQEFQNIESRWKSLRENQKRSDLLGHAANSTSTNITSFSGSAAPADGDRENLLATEKLERGSRKLDDGYRMAIDTEQYGRDILEELQREREVLERSKNRLHHANTMLSSSTDVVTQMYRHVVQDRLTLYVIGAILALIVVVVILTKVF